MVCPECNGKVKVTDTVKTSDNEIYRRRKCLVCGHQFFTAEFEVECNNQFRYKWWAHHRTTRKY